MTVFEMLRLAARPVLPVLHDRVRSELVVLIRASGKRPVALLDVGGRKSHCTIGLPAEVTILDLPRESELQHRLDLGISDRVLEDIRRRRSNVVGVVLESMTRCSLPSDSFDGVVSVEVIEHVPEDAEFISNVASHRESRGLDEQPRRTAHLLACAWRA